mmetsp:Transcript_34489/g.98980  ORF Transcript_34489/g.98980 Transcript_34489/m.98980 type:complete len:91 (-) Transcript_34489:16-288(-)
MRLPRRWLGGGASLDPNGMAPPVPWRIPLRPALAGGRGSCMLPAPSKGPSVALAAGKVLTKDLQPQIWAPARHGPGQAATAAVPTCQASG